MKKGVFLVELAIVLVIISLIMAMVTKGRGLIYTAKVREDINKIIKYQTAVESYYIINHQMPPFDNATAERIDLNELVNQGLMDPNDRYQEQFNRGKNVTIYNCNYTNGYYYRKGTYGICLVYDFDSLGSTVGIGAGAYPHIDVTCNIEAILDDSALSSGTGRGSGPAGIDFNSCRKYTGTNELNSTYNSRYVYLLMRNMSVE